MARVAPTTRPKKPQKSHDVVFDELVDLRSHVVVKGKPQRDLTTDSMMC